MVHPEPPKFYPLVTDRLFEAKVKMKPKSGKKVLEDELPMNKPPAPTLSTTNSPKRATKASVQVGGPYDLSDAKRWDGHGDVPKGYRDPGGPIAADGTAELEKEEKEDWIGDAEDDIKRRGTKGKCTPITKKGCTGKAKALAKTFKKMAKRKKNEAQESGAYAAKIKKQADDHRAANPIKKPGLQPGQTSIGDPSHPDHKPAKVESSTSKPVRQARARAEAGKPIKRGTASTVANDSGSEMSQRMKAAEKL